MLLYINVYDLSGIALQRHTTSLTFNNAMLRNTWQINYNTEQKSWDYLSLLGGHY